MFRVTLSNSFTENVESSLLNMFLHLFIISFFVEDVNIAGKYLEQFLE